MTFLPYQSCYTSVLFDKLKQLLKESIVYGLGRAIGRFTRMFLVPIYTRIFSPAAYGVMDIIGVYFSILNMFVTLGLIPAQSLYFYSTDDVKDRKHTLTTSVSFQFIFSVFIGIVLFALSLNMSKIAFGTTIYAAYFRLIALDLPFFTVLVFSQQVLRLVRLPWKYTLLTISSLLSNIALTILMVVVWRKGIYGVYLSKLAIDILFALVAAYLVYPYLGRSISLSRLKQLLAYGIPLLPSGVAFWVISSSNRYFLQHYSSLDDVGLYSIGYSIASIGGLIVNAFQLAWGAFALSIHRQEDAKQVYANVLTYYLVLTSAISIGLSLLAPEALRILATKSYYGASTVVSYLAFATLAYGVFDIISIGVYITKKTSHIGWITMLAAGANIALNFLLIPQMGRTGAAISLLISRWVSIVILYLVSQHHYSIPYRLKDAATILSSSAMLIALGSCMQLSQLWLIIPAKSCLLAVYIAILFTFRILRPGMFLRFLHRSVRFAR